MAHGRIETTPEQQLAELRVAYARYTTLAEQLRDETKLDPGERRVREQYALRIAHAYEKSIASNAMRLESLKPPHGKAHRFGPVTMIAGALVIVAASAAVLATARPDLIEALRARITAPAAAPLAAPPPLTVEAIKPVIAPVATPAPIPALDVFVPVPRPAQAEDLVQAPAKPTPANLSPAIPAPTPAKPVATPPKAAAQTAERQTPQTIASPIAPPAAQPSSPPPASRQAALEPLAPPRLIEALPSPPTETVRPAAKAVETVAPGAKAADMVTLAAKAKDTAIPPKLVPVLRTHLLPPYPFEAKKAGEQGTTQMQVSISAAGMITDCRVIESSGSERLDGTACSFVQHVWRWLPPTRDGQPATATTKIFVIWNLKTAR